MNERRVANGDQAPPNLSSARALNSLSSGLQHVLDEYRSAITQRVNGHPLARFIRTDLKQLVQTQLDAPHGSLLIKGSCGQGAWARGPWVAIFDPIITTSAQSGYYGCFLFREDMHGVYLTLTQAVTEAKAAYRADAKTALRARAAHFRALMGKVRGPFGLDHIDLAPSDKTNDTSFYEAGTICAKYYASGRIPRDEEIRNDLKILLSLYERLAAGEAAVSAPPDGESPISGSEFEDASRRRLHERVERNQRLVKKVKEAHGTSCEACGLNMRDQYGELGDGYIEAHHLRPISTLARARVEMDPAKDFAVLCANCHRMIHRSEYISDLEGFKAAHLPKAC